MNEFVIDTIKVYMEEEILNMIVCNDNKNEIIVFLEDKTVAIIKTTIIK